MRAMCLVLAVVGGGCFGPKLSGEISCAEDGLCPPGLGCFDGVCLPGQPTADADVPGADAPADAALCLSFEATHFEACSIPAPGPAMNLGDNGTYDLDTGSGTLTDPGGNDIPIVTEVIDGMRVWSIDDLTIGTDARLRPAGPLPLVIASFHSIAVDGNIDVDEGGANSNVDCGARAPTPGTNNAGGGSGGGGGGFGTDGGAGGLGDSNGNSVAGGTGGQAIASPPKTVRGGCRGRSGGDGDANTDGSSGNSGGAVQLTARVAITITGVVDAGGNGGGNGTAAGGGGGGGGSGGYIGLEAPSIELTGAVVVSNGGGGGEGADGASNGNGGQDGRELATAANGGNGGASDGGDGGDGGFLAQPGAAAAATAPGGGGGGGGGAGFILSNGSLSVDNTSIVSPDIQPIPLP